MVTWLPIETAPRDGTWILLRGESGYIDRPYRACVGKWDAEYRPLSPWQTSEGRSFEDSGDPPTHWMPLPPLGGCAGFIQAEGCDGDCLQPGCVGTEPAPDTCGRCGQPRAAHGGLPIKAEAEREARKLERGR